MNKPLTEQSPNVNLDYLLLIKYDIATEIFLGMFFTIIIMV